MSEEKKFEFNITGTIDNGEITFHNKISLQGTRNEVIAFLTEVLEQVTINMLNVQGVEHVCSKNNKLN